MAAKREEKDLGAHLGVSAQGKDGAHLEAQRMGVVAYPRVASVEHVQEHAAAAPHVRRAAWAIPSSHLGGHVGLRAGEGGSYCDRLRGHGLFS